MKKTFSHAVVILTFIPILTVWYSCLTIHADTVVMSSRERIKGVVVEEYEDRIILSTMDGEKELMKNDIRDIKYDLEEQNLTKLGDFYQDKRDYNKAYYYYKKALEINSGYKKARDGLNFVTTYIQQTGRVNKLNHIQRMNEGDRWLRGEPQEASPTKDQSLKDELGIILRLADGTYDIAYVVYKSPAHTAGIKKGDKISSVWGRSIKYMDEEEVMTRLMKPGVMDIKMIISREYKIRLLGANKSFDNLLGIKFGYSEMEGLIVEDLAKESITKKYGIDKGDRVTFVDGESTRYMPLEKVIKLINGKRNKVISVIIERDITIWKKFG